MRTTKSITISLPPEQLKKAERLARKQSRTMSELFREALRRYEQEVEWRPSPQALDAFAQALKLFREDARRAGLNKMTMREINAEIAATREDGRPKARKRTKNRSA
jgi:Arc/MetJ-type ribon-helix-helix transcriptional regulator